MKLKPMIFYFSLFSVFFFPYFNITLWKYLVASSLIFLLFYSFDRGQFKSKLGLNFKLQQVPYFAMIFMMTSLTTEFFLQTLLLGTSVTKESPIVFGTWFLQPLSQSLNEEMLLRSLFFYHFTRLISSRWIQSLVFSLLFSLGHVLFCYFVYQTTLNLYATLSFFFATILMNMIFYRYQNIFYTWALHAGINFSLFGGNYFRSNGTKVNDAEKFNLFLGTPEVCVLILAILGAVTIFYYRSNFSLKTLTVISDKD